MTEKDWKRLYEGLLQQHESESAANKELEELLARTITRLTVAAMGMDSRLDPHLKGIRDAVRKGVDRRLKEQFNSLSDGLLHFSQETPPKKQEKKTDFGRLLSFLALNDKELNELEGLLTRLVDDPSGMREADFNRLSHLIGQGGGGGGTAKRSRLFNRLFGGVSGDDQNAPQPNAILLNLLEQASWPGHWGEQINELKRRLLDQRAAPDAWTGVLEDLLTLSAKSFGEIQSEIREAEDFLEELTKRLQDLGVHLQSAHEGRDLIAEYVEALRKRGANKILVVNRTLNRALDLAQRWNGQAAALEMLLELLPDSDIVITSTGAPHTVIQASMVAKAMESRLDRPIVFMDIAVPRDVDPTVGEIPHVNLFDMDTLSEQLESALAQRSAEVPRVEKILAEELDCFMDYLATLDVVPLIVKMRQQADDIRQAELEKTIRRIPDLPPDLQQHIDLLTKSIVNKILHSPTIRLREEANGPDAVNYADIARGLFGLD